MAFLAIDAHSWSGCWGALFKVVGRNHPQTWILSAFFFFLIHPTVSNYLCVDFPASKYWLSTVSSRRSLSRLPSFRIWDSSTRLDRQLRLSSKRSIFAHEHTKVCRFLYLCVSSTSSTSMPILLLELPILASFIGHATLVSMVFSKGADVSDSDV